MNSPFPGFWFATIVYVLATIFIVVNAVKHYRIFRRLDWWYVAAQVFFTGIYIAIWITQR